MPTTWPPRSGSPGRTALPFTVRAGAHSVSGRSIRDGALCIDLRALNRVEVDPESAIVRVGGGALLGELDAATQEHGLAVPAGQVSHTGVGGLTLGGGIGWLMRRHGLTIDSLRAVEVVLADGQQVRASAAEHPDLFWAMRGGGGDFGVVTRFEFQAHRVGPMVLAGVLVYPWDRAREAFRASRELMDGAPEELTLFDVLLTAPPAEPFPPDLQGQRVAVIGVAWCGELEDGERVLAPLRASCPPALDLVGPMPYVALQSMLDATAPHGWHFYDRQHYLRDVSDDFIDALVDGFESVPTPQAHVVTSWLGGALDRVPPGETAFGHRGAKALTWIIGCSVDDPVDPVRDWVRRVWDDTAGSRRAASTSTHSTPTGRFATPTRTTSGTGSSRSSAATTRTARSPATGSALDDGSTKVRDRDSGRLQGCAPPSGGDPRRGSASADSRLAGN